MIRNKLYYYYKLKSHLRQKRIDLYEPKQNYFYNRKYEGNVVLGAQQINDEIYNLILSGIPLFVGRMGSSEQFCFNTFEFKQRSHQKKSIEQLCQWSGFFPNEKELGEKFAEEIRKAYSEVDILGVWNLPAEGYCINKYGSSDVKLTWLTSLEPWRVDRPWSRALQGKKVLVVHPFEKTILQQYKKRDKIFEGTDILPDFELFTFKAVQTIAGIKDERFSTWFDALDYMSLEIEKIDFDIAILGCGAYGFPLASRIKEMGKQAIHLGGVTQILFGIMGKRWEENEYINVYYNEYWTRPSGDEIPLNKKKVEAGCYW